jgi:hypothetical protein
MLQCIVVVLVLLPTRHKHNNFRNRRFLYDSDKRRNLPYLYKS